MDPVTVWLAVRRYDLQAGSSDEDVPTCSPLQIELSRDMNFIEIKALVKSRIGLPEDGKEVLKLRRSDGTLLTFSYLLSGNTEREPFVLDVTRVNQHGSVSSRSALPPSYAHTVQGKLSGLEKRVERVESLVPEMQTRRAADVEQTLHQLAAKVHFLDKRLDDLMPHDWKSHMQVSPA